MLGVPGVKTVRSFSMFGFSTVYVIFKDKVEFKKINVDKEGDLAVEMGIFVVPTIILEKDGVEVKKWMGFTSKEELTKAIDEALK